MSQAKHVKNISRKAMKPFVCTRMKSNGSGSTVQKLNISLSLVTRNIIHSIMDSGKTISEKVYSAPKKMVKTYSERAARCCDALCDEIEYDLAVSWELLPHPAYPLSIASFIEPPFLGHKQLYMPKSNLRIKS